MIHLLPFQSINNVLYFFLIWGSIEKFFIPHPLQKKLFFKFWGGIEFFFIPQPFTPRKNCLGGI